MEGSQHDDDTVLHQDAIEAIVAVAIEARLAERTVFTLGPASGAYDVEWENAENAVATGDSPPRLTLKSEQVFLAGDLYFTGANSSLDFGTLPEGLWPPSVVTLVVYGYDDSASVSKPIFVNINAEGAMTAQFLDGTAFAADDAITLSGSYLIAYA